MSTTDEADEILTLLDEGSALVERYQSIEQELEDAFTAGPSNALIDQILSQLEGDFAEDSIESLLRAQESLSTIIKIRIRQLLDEAEG
jgi:hypothetical protein